MQIIVEHGKHDTEYYDASTYEEEQRFYERAKRALDTNDGALAWQVLRDRSDYEYEQVELVTLL